MIEPFKINENSGVPVWIQIRNRLIFYIKSEKLKAGDLLPTVREFAAELGVNYNTIHRVYQDLETDGLIVSSRGKRSFVADVDREALKLPDSPVDLAIEELVKSAQECCVSEEDVFARLRARFSKA